MAVDAVKYNSFSIEFHNAVFEREFSKSNLFLNGFNDFVVCIV